MNIPEELKYTSDHEWIKLETEKAEDGSAIVTVGITDFAQGELGDVVFVEIESVGESMSKGDVFGTVEAVKTVSDLFMPVSGEIIEKNENLDNAPEQVNSDPYADGWMIRIKVTDQAELEELLDAAAYKDSVEA